VPYPVVSKLGSSPPGEHDITHAPIRVEDVIKEFLPVYQKHFTLSEIQELNKFYSTDIMQGLVAKLPLITQDAAPIQVKLFEDYDQRLSEQLNAVLLTDNTGENQQQSIEQREESETSDGA